MNAVDTNILIYAKDPRDPAKKSVAASLIQTLIEGALLWQVACEYLAASRKLESLGYSCSQAWQDLRKLQGVWFTLRPTWDVVGRAEQFLTDYSPASANRLRMQSSRACGVTRF